MQFISVVEFLIVNKKNERNERRYDGVNTKSKKMTSN